MKYQHRFRVRAPLEAVADLHSRSASMAAITPPPIIVRVHRSPEIQREGDEMNFTMWSVLQDLQVSLPVDLDAKAQKSFSAPSRPQINPKVLLTTP